MLCVQYSLLLLSDAMCADAVQFIIVSDAMCAVQFIIPSIIVVDSEKTAEDQIRFKGTMSVISIDQPYIHGNA